MTEDTIRGGHSSIFPETTDSRSADYLCWVRASLRDEREMTVTEGEIETANGEGRYDRRFSSRRRMLV